MPDDTQSLDERKNTLLAEFIFDEKRYLRLARFNYYAAQGLLWASLAASSLAALLEPLPFPAMARPAHGDTNAY